MTRCWVSVEAAALLAGRTAARDIVNGRQRVLDYALTYLFHRNPLQLVRTGAGALEARQRASSELLGSLSGDIDEQEAAGDWNSRFGGL